MAKGRSFFSRGRKVQTTDRFLSELERGGLIMQSAGSSDGSEWIVDGTSLRNFGSCSYMGLERHPALIASAEAALREYGSNFSISRAYLECSLYRAFEEALDEVTGRFALVAPSTTMAHLAALPVLIGDRDLVLIDQFAHASMHMATDLVDDVPIELLRHSRLDLLEQRIIDAGARFERIWYLCDGVYSMLGDFAPFEGLKAMLKRHPELHLYVDDAHAMSWTGRHGRGAALSHLGESDRVIVATSLSKAFGAVGGAVVFPTAEQRSRVRRCGGPMIFSGRRDAGRAARAGTPRARHAGERRTAHRDERQHPDPRHPLRFCRDRARRGERAARSRLLLVRQHVPRGSDEQAEPSLHGEPAQLTRRREGDDRKPRRGVALPHTGGLRTDEPAPTDGGADGFVTPNYSR
jgi:7-keto-8-aminopelargonate synthetase-like enzyme